MLLELVAIVCLGWYIFILVVQFIGVVQLRRLYLRPPSKPISSFLPLPDVPHVTVIRPVKGIEPYLYECLAATFQQNYPSEKLTIYFCISTCNDPAHPILERLLRDFPEFDAKIYVEEEDPNLMCTDRDCREHNYSMGPNPKIRNMSRAYRESKGDIMWIIDCNVWISPSVAALMVDQLCGFGLSGTRKRKYKFVHQLPLVVDVSDSPSQRDSKPDNQSLQSRILSSGGLLEELFLSTSHSKFYTAISTVAVAPCTVGKSNMFRRSHLDALTYTLSLRQAVGTAVRPTGIDYFSNNICEDHLIGDLLWKMPVLPSVVQNAATEGGTASSKKNVKATAKWANHALVAVPPCIQPLSHLPLPSYTARRTRWLRVRKYTVLIATLIEPGVESLVCSTYGAFGLTTLPICHTYLGIPRTWSAFWTIWWGTMIAWVSVDYYVWTLLQRWSGEHLQADEPKPPPFVGSGRSRPFKEWFAAWLGRELLAFPIWFVAVMGGTRVKWRGRTFKVGMDARVKEVRDGRGGGEGVGAVAAAAATVMENGSGSGRKKV